MTTNYPSTQKRRPIISRDGRGLNLGRVQKDPNLDPNFFIGSRFKTGSAGSENL